MRIAHVTATFPPNYTGTGLVCYHNALELARRGHQVTVLTTANSRANVSLATQVSVRYLRPIAQYGNAPVLPGLLTIKGFDIVHLHCPFISGADMIYAASCLRPVAYVITHHNDLIGQGSRRLLFDAYSRLAARTVYRRARKLAVVSLEHALSGRFADLFAARRSDVAEISNGVDVELFRPGLDGAAVRGHLGIPRHAPVLLFVGVLDSAHHYRRIEVLLRALAVLRHRDTLLIVAGTGPATDFYRGMAWDLGIWERVRFVGRVDNCRLPELYNAADIVVLPSQLQEAFPLVILEGFACAKPAVASDLPGVRSLVEPGVTGLLTAPGDSGALTEKLDALLDDPAGRAAMGESARAKVEAQYTWARAADRLEALYTGALG